MYTLVLDARVQSDMRRLPSTIHARILEKLERLCENCDNHPHKALKGKYRGKFTLTVARDYRIVYSFDARNRKVSVHKIGHRSSVY
jgi:mRNA interferase RelE/StbE